MKNTDSIKILYIDDEANNLVGFKASFRLDYTIYTAIDTDAALKVLEQHNDIRMIFCDQRMPDKTGVQFFGEIRDVYPLPIRMLITGYTDIESVINAINQGNIYRYIKKPWTDMDIRSAIEEANKFYLTNSMLALKNEQLEKAYHELDKFAYSVTHDIRGPLMSMLGAIDIAKTIDDLEEIRTILGMMELSAQKLDNFVRSVHDYYSLKQGDLTIEQVSFQALVDDLAGIYDVGGKINNVDFRCQINQQEVFRSDIVYLKIILNNLLSNAYKYQQKEKSDKFVALDIEVNKGNAVITVRDNGIGIEKSRVGDIFNMFYRATTEESGSGFGLYNVKDALNKLNGEISVNSELGAGTTFSVTIPTK